MKRKILTVFLAVCAATCLCFGLAACNTDNPDDGDNGGTGHTHSLTHTAANVATCEEEGNIEYWYCSGCGKYFGDANATTEITWDETVAYQTEHNFVDGVCTDCGYLQAYKLLTFTLSQDGTYYSVTNCVSSATEVFIPSTYNDLPVTSIGDYAFSHCTSLTSVTIPDDVTSIGDYAFSGCTALESITIPDSVASIGEYAFYNCSGLTSIDIPDSVTSIGEYAFSDCTALTEINYNATKCADLSSSNQVFSNAGNNGEGITVTIGANVKKIPAYLFYPRWYSPNIVSVVFAKNSQCESIGAWAFYNCTSLESIAIGDSVTSIGSWAFQFCSGLTSVTISDSVTFIGNSAFSGCSGLMGVTIGNSVTSIGNYAFQNCTSLMSIDIPDSVTSIGNYAFQNCASLTNVTLGSGVESIGDSAFYKCTSLKSITIPDGVTSIGKKAFSQCTALTSVTFEHTSSWWVSDSDTARSGKNISDYYLAKVSTAATYLTSTYEYMYWKRSEN